MSGIIGEQVTFGVGMGGEGDFGVTMSIVNDGVRIVFLLPASTARAYARVMECAATQAEDMEAVAARRAREVDE